MIEPNKPVNEKERLAYLKKLGVLDTPIEERFERITRIVCRTLDVPIAAISLIDDERQWFKSIQGLTASETPRNIAFCAHAILNDDMFIVADASKDPRFIDNPLVTQDPNIRFYAGCPLTFDNDIRIGTLCAIDTKARQISVEHLSILQDLAQMVISEISALSLSKAHQNLIMEYEEVERASLIDPLSRLWNRAGGNQIVEREWEISKRNSAPISLAMLDIDYFKKINDQYGHNVGDEVIRSIARTIISSLRTTDVACRWGGEEFLLILPRTDTIALKNVLDRVIKTLMMSPIKTTKDVIAVTASIGACTAYPATGADLSATIEHSDQALYKAKNSGRNQYMISPKS